MGTEINTKMTDHTVKEFWGGDTRGRCLQITASSPMRVRETVVEQAQEEGFIQLTMEEAAALCNDLGGFVKREAMRRQALLKAEIEQAKIAEKTVFHEVASLPSDLMGGAELAVMMVSRFCPKTHKESQVSRKDEG
ncbi:MAG: hypothetical protein WC277_08300 [Bacilli bacterium]